jgi:flagellar hook-length control protein FliK
MQIQASVMPPTAAVTVPTSTAPELTQGSDSFGRVLDKEMADQKVSEGATPTDNGNAVTLNHQPAVARVASVQSDGREAVIERVIEDVIKAATESSAIPSTRASACPEADGVSHAVESNTHGGEDGSDSPSAAVAVLALVSGLQHLADLPREGATTEPLPAASGTPSTRPALRFSPEGPTTPSDSKAPTDGSAVLDSKGVTVVAALGTALASRPVQHDGEVRPSATVDSLPVPATSPDSSAKSVIPPLERTVSVTTHQQRQDRPEADLQVSAAQTPTVALSPIELPARSPVQTAEKLQPWVGTPAWENALGHKIGIMIGERQQTASLTLNPPDLGPLQVFLTVNNDQASAAFFAAEPEVRRAVEAAIPRLREIMDAAGIHLGEATVGAGTSGHDNAFTRTPHPTSARTSDGDESASVGASSRLVIRPVSQGLVDTFV